MDSPPPLPSSMDVRMCVLARKKIVHTSQPATGGFSQIFSLRFLGGGAFWPSCMWPAVVLAASCECPPSLSLSLLLCFMLCSPLVAAGGPLSHHLHREPSALAEDVHGLG